MEQANIIYLMYDQAKASAMSFLGNQHIPMPFANKLAEQGWCFEEAYATSPICTPSRTSVHTGVYPLVHQVTCHQNRAPFNLPQLAEILKDAGYYTAVAGHYEPERNLSRGWHEQSPMHERGPLYESWLEHIRSGRKDVAWSSGAIDSEAKDGNSARLTDRMMRMLEQAQMSKQPFFLHLCYDDPHPPYFVPRPYDTIINPDSLPLPPEWEETLLPAWQAKARAECGTALASEEDFRKVLAIYYGMIAYIDAEMARFYDALEATGLLENSWIILSSDHGDYTGEKGLFNKSESLYKCLLHVPLIIVPPGHQRSGSRRIKDLVSTVDLFPTILRMAGLEVPEYVQGYDLLEWVNAGSGQPLRNAVYAQVGNYHGFIGTSFPTGMPASGRHNGFVQSARSLSQCYIHDPDNGDEAYDLDTDPYELRNHLNEPKAVLSEGFVKLKNCVAEFEQECLELRNKLKIIPGDRGFVRAWE